MKIKLLIPAVATLIGMFLSPAFGEQKDTTSELSKRYFISAKSEIEKMLKGTDPLSFEKSIYLLENAYWDNKIDPDKFRSLIDKNVEIINHIALSNTVKEKIVPSKDLWQDLRHLRNKEIGYFDKAVSNWAIFHFMTDTINYFSNNTLVHKPPYAYSSDDPFGTTDWSNTEVAKLMITGKGNCFAFTSLFKIFSERLHSDANICTAPCHVYISHKDNNGTRYNVEVSSKCFPGTGTMETLTYTTSDAVKNDISLRELNLKQSVALCLVYLAKGYEYKFKMRGDKFALQCAELALKYDSLNLNAMLLKAEVLETELIAKNKSVATIQNDKTFRDYQNLICRLFQLGYREMPLELKNTLIKEWKHDTTVAIITKDHTAHTFDKLGVHYNRYSSLSWGLFDEEIKNKPIEKYGKALFDTKKKKIIQFTNDDILYNDYNFDPIVFALNVDPLSYKFPSQSPYCAFDNSPIWKNDPTGASGEVAINKQARTITISSNLILYGGASSPIIATSTARDIQNKWNEPGGTVKIDGTTYKVQFSVTGSYDANLKPSDISSNTSFQNNYIRVEETVKGGISYMDGAGSNTGYFLIQNIQTDGSTTEAHEFGHGYGLEHPGSDQRGQGQPGIMSPRGSAVDAPYTYDPSKGATFVDPNNPNNKSNTINPETRKVTQQDITKLGLDKLHYDQNGKANLGGITNKPHEKTE